MISLVNGKIYVARIIGGASSQEALDMAGEAILRGYQDWQNKKFWRFLLKDTSLGFTVAGVSGNSATLSAPSSGTFDGVNVGVTITVSGNGATLADNTTVSSFTRSATDGTITTITLSASVTGSSGVYTATFSGNIPIIAGTNEYNLPTDFNAAFTARMLVAPRTLTWRDQRWWDRMITDQTVQGTPDDYTTYNPISDLTQNFGANRLKFDRIPNVSDTLLLRYYRKFSVTGTNIDMIDDFLYQFLDYCANILLQRKKAQDDPAAYEKGVKDAQQGAADTDEEPTDDNDYDQCMKSQYEMGPQQRNLWNNGQYDPYYGG